MVACPNLRSALPRLVSILIATMQVDVFGQSAAQVRWWRGNYQAALDEAKIRNVPLLIVVIQDGEEANERLVDGVIRSKEFAALSEKTVAIILSRTDHGSKPQEIDGSTLTVCKRFGYVPCDTHMQLEAKLILEIFQGGTVVTPQVMVARPDLTVEERVIDVAGQGEYSSAVSRVLKKMGPGFDRKTFSDLRKAIQAGKTAVANRAWGEAWAAVAPIVSVGVDSPLTKEAEMVRTNCLNHFNRLVEEIRAAASSGERVKAFAILDTLEADAKSTEFATQVASLDKELRKTKEGRTAAVEHDKQKKLEPLMKRAAELESKADWLRAYDIYAKIVSQAGALPIGLRAKARIESLNADADISKLLSVEMESQASRLLGRAEAAITAGKKAEAETLYDKILAEYPKTVAAVEVAKRRRP